MRAALGLLAGAGSSAASAQLAPPIFGNGSTTADPSADAISRASTDYRALVCVYLYGGNDGFNMLVPSNGAFYSQYAQARGGLAVPQSELLSLNGADADGRQYGLHPSTPELRTLYNAGRLAMVNNVGTLLAPTSKADYLAKRHLPPQMFSHLDQSEQSMSSRPDAFSRSGWGGQLGAQLMSGNENQDLSINISTAGNNLFQTGGGSVPYVVGSGGVARLRAFQGDSLAANHRQQAYLSMLDRADSGHIFETHASGLTRRSMALVDQVNNAMSGAPEFSTTFPGNNRLAKQLQLVARMIAGRAALRVRRQVFFVSISGFDTHSDQLGTHPMMLQQVSQALSSFYQATQEMGVADQVTTYSMSDFGRTLSSNGNGSDHGWGNVAMVMGGSVAGGRTYGRFPDLTLNGADDSGNGRIIPGISWDQYGATLGRWLGASESDLQTIFPHLGRFATSNLGFMG